MEVHHHPDLRHDKKHFKEYFLEFLMIFLAVTLGFVAENVREYFTDSKRAAEYIKSLYEDLKTDTANMNRVIAYDDEKINALRTMTNCFDTVSENLKSTDCMGILVKYSKTNRSYQLTDRTLRQLSNTGGYRLLEKEDADSVMVYEGKFRQYLNFESTAYQEAQDNVRNTLNAMANFKIMEPMQKAISLRTGVDSSITAPGGPLLFSADKGILNRWFNELLLYMRVHNAQRIFMIELSAEASNLLAYYKEKHHL